MKKTCIIILHGWKLDGSKYKNLKTLLEKKSYQVFAPDLPGFGSEELGENTQNLGDYVRFLNNFMLSKRVEKAVLLGHSFGGRVAIKYASMYPDRTKSLILTGVPVIRHRKGGVFLANGVKAVRSLYYFLPENVVRAMRKGLYFAIGEWDYYKSDTLRKVFVNVVNEDLKAMYSRLKVPVIVVWGEKDTFTPVSDVKKLKRLLPQAKYHVVSGDHSVVYKNPELFVSTIEREIN